MVRRVIVFSVLGIAFVGLLLYSQRGPDAVVVSGLLEADEIRVGSRVGGRVRAVRVSEGQPVRAGDVLLELEPFDLLERKAEAEQRAREAEATLAKLVAGFRPEEIAQARARRDQRQADLDRLLNGPRPQEIAAAESELRLAESEQELARSDYARAETLFGRDALERDLLDAAATQLSVAQARVESRRQQLALLQEGTRAEEIARARALLREAEAELTLRSGGFRDEEIAEARARSQAAAAAARAVERQLDELNVRAPTDAVVEAVDLEPGDLLGANVPAVSLTGTGDLWVRAYVPQRHLDLRTGETVHIVVDSLPERRFPGEVVFVARKAEFTPANVQTPEERAKQVFRIKVRIRDDDAVLRPGMAADVILKEESAGS